MVDLTALSDAAAHGTWLYRPDKYDDWGTIRGGVIVGTKIGDVHPLATRTPHSTVVDQMASIYASFSERQELLGEEFEAAIFDDLDSLYES